MKKQIYPVMLNHFGWRQLTNNLIDGGYGLQYHFDNILYFQLHSSLSEEIYWLLRFEFTENIEEG